MHRKKKAYSTLLILLVLAFVLTTPVWGAGYGGRAGYISGSSLDEPLPSLPPTSEALASKPDALLRNSQNADSKSSVTSSVYLKAPTPDKPSSSLELKDKRTLNTKTYLLGKDTYETVVSSEPLHYQDQEGNWQDISLSIADENELTATQEVPWSKDALPEVPAPVLKDGSGKLRTAPNLQKLTKDAFRALQVPFDIRIGKQFKQGYEIGKGESRLSFVPVGANPSHAVRQKDENGGAYIRYASAWSATYVDLQLIPSGLKETIVLESASAPSSFTYEVTSGLGKDLKWGNLQIDPAWLIDAKGVYREVSQTIRTEGGKTYLDLRPDLSGLAYPVRIDPTIRLTGVNNNMMDTTVNAHEPDRNYGSEPRLYTGKDTNGNQFRTLLKFDLSQIPAGEYQVLEAYLTLNQTAEYQYNAYTNVELQRITSAWDENAVTWNTQPAYAPDADGHPYASAPVYGEGQQIFAIKDLAEEWLNGLYPNYGIELHADNAAAPNVKKYVSSNTTAQSDYPSLTLKYVLPDQTWSSTTANADALGSFNQKKIDYTSDGYEWLLVRDGKNLKIVGKSPDDSVWFKAGSSELSAANASFYIDQDDYGHVAYKASDGSVRYVRANYNPTSHRWTFGTPVTVSTDPSVNYPDLVVHRALAGGGWNVHIVTSKNNASANSTLYNRMDISASGIAGAPGAATVLDSGSVGAPTWPSIDFQHTPTSSERGKAVKDGQPALFVAWNSGNAGGGLGIRYKQAAYSAGSWSWGSEQAVDESRYTLSDRDWFLSVYDGSRSVVFGALRGTSDQQNLLAYTFTEAGKVQNLLVTGVSEGKQALYGSGSYDAQGNLYFTGLSKSGGDFITFKWLRASTSLTLPKTLMASSGTAYAVMKRGDSFNRIELATSHPSGSEPGVYEVEHSVILDTVERQFTQYAYDAASRLKYILMQSGDGIKFTYDAAGNLTRRELDEQPDTNGSNLLINGGFEVTETTPGADNPTDPNYGWRTYTEPGSTGTYTPVDQPVDRGTKAMKLTVSGLAAWKSDFVYQTIGVNAGQPFRLSGKINKQSLNQAVAALSVEFLAGDLTVLGSYEQTSSGVSSGYETLLKKGWIPEGTVFAKVYVKINSTGSGAAGTVFADQIKLEYEDSNQVWNPGFEVTDDGAPYAWSTYTATGATASFSSVTEAFEGTRAIRVTTQNQGAGAYSFAHQTHGIGAGEPYTASVAYRADGLSNAAAVLALQFFDENGGSLGWIEQTGNLAGNYGSLVLGGNAPDGAVSIKIMTGIKGTGTGGQGSVYFDKASLNITPN
ncbi:DNRLRE domain-containing protein [Paenibacillus spiritus]|uniref:DNRLRE domain-containing protein n=1 Tax=Paenibacillus spiritus TaxID=2496557 RepID=A0A5J5GJK7_9BACL|nr:DNRLRE domain-containing protein [Paenibacillus spiritus]KAA9008439.1 DNRLRE domain-containing protein [Paenibacillus spiritus]